MSNPRDELTRGGEPSFTIHCSQGQPAFVLGHVHETQSRRARGLDRADGTREESGPQSSEVQQVAIWDSKPGSSGQQETGRVLEEGVSVRQTGLLASLVGTENRSPCRYLGSELVSQEREESSPTLSVMAIQGTQTHPLAIPCDPKWLHLLHRVPLGRWKLTIPPTLKHRDSKGFKLVCQHSGRTCCVPGPVLHALTLTPSKLLPQSCRRILPLSHFQDEDTTAQRLK